MKTYKSISGANVVDYGRRGVQGLEGHASSWPVNRRCGTRPPYRTIPLSSCRAVFLSRCLPVALFLLVLFICPLLPAQTCDVPGDLIVPGKVGIGTTNTLLTEKLSIAVNTASVYQTIIAARQQGTGSAGYMAYNEGGGNGFYGMYSAGHGNGWSIGLDSLDSNKFKLRYQYDFSPGTEKLTVDSSGNVGIGVTSPIATLHIGDSANLPSNVYLFSKSMALESSGNVNSIVAGGGAALLTVYDKTAQSGYKAVGLEAYLNKFYLNSFSDNLGGPWRYTFISMDPSNGNVGIGTTSPTNILTVKQGASTNPIASAWTVYSSRRWKENIQPLGDALDTVARLRGVSFDWKENGKHDIGMIAEEVGEVVPEVVAFEDNGKDAKSVDYARLVAVLIEAVKSQQKEISALMDKVEALENSKNRIP